MASTLKSPARKSANIPNWLRVISILWLLIWVPVYWRTWGASNFLEMCDIAVILTCAGLWFRSVWLISSQAVSSLVVDIVWLVDAACRLFFGRHVIGGTAYLFDASVPLWIRLLSLFHIALLFIFWEVFRRNGYDRRGYALQCAIALPVFAASRFTLPAKNMNFAFADPFFHKQWGPAPVHVVVTWLFMVGVVYLPTHVILAKLFPTSRFGQSSMRATEFEFRFRAVIGTMIFFVAMALYSLDHRNIVNIFAEGIAGGGAGRRIFLLHVSYGVGAMLVLFAALIRTWAAAYLTSDVVQDPALHANVVVADGPYRYVRNPLYLGGMLFAFGISTLANAPGFLLICVAQTVFFYRMIALEESNFDAQQGNRYRAYCAQVPRLWPSLTARVPKGNVKPRWVQGFFGEIFMWGFFAAMAAWAITLSKTVAWWTLGFAFLLYVVRSGILYTRRKRAVTS